MDVPVREEGAADDEVILFTDVIDSFSIVCGFTYSMLSNDFLCSCCCTLPLH